MYIIIIAVVAVVSLGVGFVVNKTVFKKSLLVLEEEAKEKAARYLKESRVKQDSIKKEKILEAKERYIKLKSEFESETASRKEELKTLEHKLQSREDSLKSQIDKIDRKELELESQEENVTSQLEFV